MSSSCIDDLDLTLIELFDNQAEFGLHKASTMESISIGILVESELQNDFWLTYEKSLYLVRRIFCGRLSKNARQRVDRFNWQTWVLMRWNWDLFYPNGHQSSIRSLNFELERWRESLVEKASCSTCCHFALMCPTDEKRNLSNRLKAIQKSQLNVCHRWGC